MPSDIINIVPPLRRWSRAYEITLSDTLTDQNLLRNGVPYLFLQNVGTAGLVMIAWSPDFALEDIYLTTGQVIEGGLWLHAKTTGTGGGVSLRGFVGMGGNGNH